MTNPINKTTHVTDGLKRLLWQFRDRPNMRAIVKAYLIEIQELEDMLYSLMAERYVLTAVGVQLDGIGAVVGETRQNRTDDDYRIAILGRITRNKAHSRIEDIIALFVLLLPTFTFTISEGPGPAAFQFFVNEALTGSDPSPEVLTAQLHDAKGAGIYANFFWSEYPESNTFTMADGSTLQSDVNRGFADAPPSTQGGYLAGVLE